MWLAIVWLALGVLPLKPIIGGTRACKDVAVSARAHDFLATINLSRIFREGDEAFYNCIWLKNGHSQQTAGVVQWTGRLQITHASNRYRSECTNTTVEIIHGANGVAESIAVQPNVIGNGEIIKMFSKEMLIDFNDGVGIFANIL